ncbi:esterase [Synechococcus sp. CS-1328]|nr:esterase [Synechococcus sp. CS-1328]
MTSPFSSDPEQLRLGPEQAATRLVLLHGWGADADDLLDLGELLVGPEVSVVALRAPDPHPAGQGRQWYDLQQPEWPQLPQARSDLRQRLKQLATTVPLANTALLGFSQGAAMAIDVATSASTEGLPLAALVSCSGYPHPGWQPGPLHTPVLLTHGEQDPVVPFAASLELERQLARVAQPTQPVRRLAFVGGHTIEADLLPRIRAFLAQHLKPSTTD